MKQTPHFNSSHAPAPKVTVSVDGAPVTGALPRAGTQSRQKIDSSRNVNALPGGNSSGSLSSDSAGDSGLLQVELLELLTSNLPEQSLRGKIRMLAIRFAGAIGVGHLICDAFGNWELRSDHGNGRLPRSANLVGDLAKCCDTAIKTNALQVDALPQVQEGYGLFAPINVSAGSASDASSSNASSGEILLVVVGVEAEHRGPIAVTETLARVFTECLQKQNSASHQWQIETLSAIIDLVSRVEGAADPMEAMTLIANELTRYLGIGSVALAFVSESQSINQVTVSGMQSIDTRTAGYHAWQQCLAESVLRNEAGLWPPINESQDQLLMAHRQLASALHAESVFSSPLQTVEGTVVGAWAFAGTSAQMSSLRFQRFAAAAAPRIAGALDSVARSAHPTWLRRLTELPQTLRRRKSRIALGAVGLFCLMMLLPVSYRVRCHCTVEPNVRRFAVAPFDGTVLKGFVRPGDEVKQGQVLAEMDGRALRYELAGISAEHGIALKQRAIELADRDIPEMLLAEMDGQRLQAEQDLLDYKKNHLQIKSPVDGVVLAGSLEQAEASAVRTGDVLFEVGTLDQVLVHIEIPADEVAQVEPGQHVTVWIAGRESQPVVGTIARLRPQSELKHAQNVFIAEMMVERNGWALLPGMQGAARVEGHTHMLGWNLFHKPFDFLRSRMTW